jgi:hypothetical protein
MCIPTIVGSKRLSKIFTTTTNTRTKEELLDLLFAVRSVSYQRRESGSLYPCIVARYKHVPASTNNCWMRRFLWGPCRIGGKWNISFPQNFLLIRGNWTAWVLVIAEMKAVASLLWQNNYRIPRVMAAISEEINSTRRRNVVLVLIEYCPPQVIYVIHCNNFLLQAIHEWKSLPPQVLPSPFPLQLRHERKAAAAAAGFSECKRLLCRTVVYGVAWKRRINNTYKSREWASSGDSSAQREAGVRNVLVSLCSCTCLQNISSNKRMNKNYTICIFYIFRGPDKILPIKYTEL